MAKAQAPLIDKETTDIIRKSEKVYISDVHVLVAGGDYKLAGLLSQITYWVTPNDKGSSKLRIEHDGKLWIAKTNEDMSKESKLNIFDVKSRKVKAVELGYIEIKRFIFNKKVTTHIWVTPYFTQVLKACSEWVSKNEVPFYPKDISKVLDYVVSTIVMQEKKPKRKLNRKKRQK